MVEFGKIIDTIQHVRRIPQDAELEIEYVENEWCFGGFRKAATGNGDAAIH